MGEQWTELIGHVVDEKFPLREVLEGSGPFATFVTEYGGAQASLKLIRAESVTASDQLSAWERASKLSHPNLIRVFATGSTEINGSAYLYAVSQRGEFNLSQMLTERPLTSAETEEMLRPMLDALESLHKQGLVHGDLRPPNVMVIADTLKLSTDSIHASGIRKFDPSASHPYRAPEQKAGEVSPGADIWALGITLAEALTRKVPSAIAIENHSFGQSIPAKLQDVIQHCLVRDPKQRWNTSAIRKALDGAPPAERKDELTTLREVAHRAVPPEPKAPSRKFAVPIFLFMAFLVIASIAFWIMRGRSAAPSTPSTRAGVPSSTASSSPTTKKAAPPIADQAAPAQTSAERSTEPQTVLHQVIPTVSQNARNTITGTVRVRVRMTVDNAGKVTNTEFESAGPSRYFARLAMEAARQWEFTPGAPGSSVVEFQFRRDGVRAVPVNAKSRG